MTCTTQQLQVMEDAEINEAIALKLGMVINSYCGDAVMCGYEGLRSTFADRDYCNNPNDIMPLAFERGIKLECVACPAGSGFVYYAKSYDGKLQSDYDSACRAIACLILMMED